MAVEQAAHARRKVYHRLIDVDVHPGFKEGPATIYPYLSEAWKRKLERLARPGPDPYTNRYKHPEYGLMIDATPPNGGPPGSDPDFVRSSFLDRYGVDVALLVALEAAAAAVAAPNPDMAATLTSAYNDHLVETWLGDPRFRLALVVTPNDPVAAAHEVRRLGALPEIAGVFLPPINVRFGSRYFHPIYEAAIEFDLPIVVHPAGIEGTYVGTAGFAGGSPELYSEYRLGWAELGQAAICSLILRGTFNRYPKLKFLFLEFGFSWAVPLLWRMDKAWKELRIEMPWLTTWPSEYFRHHVFLSTQPVDEPPRQADLNHLIESYLADSLAYSSDYPHWDTDTPGTVFLNLPHDVKERIFYKNAESVLRLK